MARAVLSALQGWTPCPSPVLDCQFHLPLARRRGRRERFGLGEVHVRS